MSQISFPPDVLARIAPDLSLQRHLAIGLRPNLRNFTEFRPISVSHDDDLPTNSNVVATTVAKCGATTIINTLTVGIAEPDYNVEDAYASISPVVEIPRGRSGEPIDEEQILSQQLYETVYHSKIIPSSSLSISCGLRVDSEQGEETVYYPDTHPEEYSLAADAAGGLFLRKKVRYVLLLHCKVLSRQASTSALFDLLYAAVINTLRVASLPRVYSVLSSVAAKVSMRSRTSGKRGLIGTAATSFCLDMSRHNRLALADTRLSIAGYSSNFGVVRLLGDIDADVEQAPSVLLCDIEGEAEETSVLLRISVVATSEGKLRKVSLAADAESPISLEGLRNAIQIAKMRASDVCN